MNRKALSIAPIPDFQILFPISPRQSLTIPAELGGELKGRLGSQEGLNKPFRVVVFGLGLEGWAVLSVWMTGKAGHWYPVRSEIKVGPVFQSGQMSE